MQSTDKLSLEVFNWQPAAYAHPSWWPESMELVPDRAHSSARFKARLSRSLLIRYRLLGCHTGPVAPLDWLLWSPDAINTIAFELGIAIHSSNFSSALDRRTVLEFIALLGVSGRDRALYYCRQFGELAAIGKSCKAAPVNRRVLVDAGGKLLTELIRQRVDQPVDQGCALRLSMRFSRSAMQSNEIRCSSAALIDAERLVEQVCVLLQDKGESD